MVLANQFLPFTKVITLDFAKLANVYPIWHHINGDISLAKMIIDNKAKFIINGDTDQIRNDKMEKFLSEYNNQNRQNVFTEYNDFFIL